jgi:NDP-sugar pyrophosphorylase family protein
VADGDVDKFGMCVTDAPDGAATQTGRIHWFMEKPSLKEAGNCRLANTGFYVIEASLYPHLQTWYQAQLSQERAATSNETLDTVGQFDFATHVFGACLSNKLHLHAIDVPAFWCDIGNPAQFAEALHWAYSKQISGLPLPSEEAMHRYYEPTGVFYFPKAYEAVSAKGYRGAGGVIWAAL